MLKQIFIAIIFFAINTHAIFNYCKWYDCEMQTTVTTSVPTDYSVRSWPLVVHNTFVDFAKVDFTSPATTLHSNNGFDVAITVNNITHDPCINGNCWMHVVIDSEYPLDMKSLHGYYVYNHNTLSLYPTFDFGFPKHINNTAYSVTLQTCIIDSANNYCLENNSKKSYTNQFQRIYL